VNLGLTTWTYFRAIKTIKGVSTVGNARWTEVSQVKKTATGDKKGEERIYILMSFCNDSSIMQHSFLLCNENILPSSGNYEACSYMTIS
jgi:hypothetical protein